MKNEPKELRGLRYEPADIAPEFRGLRAERIEEDEPETEATKRGTKGLAKRPALKKPKR